MIKFENNIPSVIGTIKNVQKQVRFAGSLAVNDTTKEVQSFTVGKLLPDKFTLRAKGSPWQKPGSKLGFNIRPFSTPGTLTATVGSQANWLNLQEHGGTKQVAGHRVAVVIEARPNKTAVIPRNLKPRRLLNASKKGIVLPTKAGDGIYVRENKQLRLMYLLKPSTKIDARMEYEKTGSAMAFKAFEGHFLKRWAVALATAK